MGIYFYIYEFESHLDTNLQFTVDRKGFCPNLTSKMSEESRNKWKQKYINIKRGVVVTTLTTVTLIDLKSFAVDLFYSKLKRFGYKTAIVVLAGPYIQLAGTTLYLLGNIGKLRLVAVTLSDIGSTITCGEMGMACRQTGRPANHKFCSVGSTPRQVTIICLFY
jgi:uncharacterized protein YnzC (UPF0291/DUF896 family)